MLLRQRAHAHPVPRIAAGHAQPQIGRAPKDQNRHRAVKRHLPRRRQRHAGAEYPRQIHSQADAQRQKERSARLHTPSRPWDRSSSFFAHAAHWSNT